jgi:hypothetical protein
MTDGHISSDPASNDTDWSTYSQVEEHGRLAPAGCTATPHCASTSRKPERGGASARAGKQAGGHG